MTPGDRDASVWDSLDSLYTPHFPDSCVNGAYVELQLFFFYPGVGKQRSRDSCRIIKWQD